MHDVWNEVRHVILDWNGTLLNDVDLAVEGVNRVCARFGLPAVTREFYRSQFRFPISQFYTALGFDLDRIPFATIISQYLSVFDARVKDCELNEGVVEFLDCLRQNGIGLSILSASYRPTLVATIQAKGLGEYFTYVSGLEDEKATSKLAEGRVLHRKLGLPPHQIAYLGDTTHDAEIAQALGWRSWILSCGHQDGRQLESCDSFKAPGIPVLLERLTTRFTACAPNQASTGRKSLLERP